MAVGERARGGGGQRDGRARPRSRGSRHAAAVSVPPLTFSSTRKPLWLFECFSLDLRKRNFAVLSLQGHLGKGNFAFNPLQWCKFGFFLLNN